MPANEERIALLLDKTTDFDKDERYMATSDLCHELQKDTELGSYFEPKVCAAVLKQLDDKSNDVQSIAVKCLGILVTKVQEAQVADICAKLCDLILHGKSELRDIYAIGLKTILTDVSSATGNAIATGLCARLLPGVSSSSDKDPAIKSETLDILTDLLRRFGRALATEHATLLRVVVAQLSDASPLVRKRATVCVGSLGAIASDALLLTLIEQLLAAIDAAHATIDVRTFIQTIGTLSRTTGHRLGRHLDAIVPILLSFCGSVDDESLQNEASDELRENCFQAFEAFVVRCHHAMTPHVVALLPVVLAFVQYDPNYNYGEEEDEEEDEEDEAMDEDDEDDEDDGDYSDDDDTSWKVRRAGLRVLAALITTRSELLSTFYDTSASLLVTRFKEREENVRIDVFGVFAELLRAVRRLQTGTTGAGTGSFAPLPQRRIVVAATKQFNAKASVASRCAVLAVLTELAHSASSGSQWTDALPLVLPNVLRATDDKHSDVKIDALVFVRLVLDTNAPEAFAPFVPALVDAAVQCAQSDWYKTVATALSVIESLVHVLAALGSAEDTARLAAMLYDAILPRLQAHDIDQEIKEAAISAIGQLLATLGDALGPNRVAVVLPLLMDRLMNEITRVSSMKALRAIAQSPLALDMAPILAPCSAALAQLLRQQSRTLKHAALDALDSLIVWKGAGLTPTLLADVVTEASALVVDSDLALCRTSIVLLRHALEISPPLAATDAMRLKALPHALTLARSAMLQGPTLVALQQLFAQLTAINASGSSFTDLFAALVDDAPVELTKHAVLNVARCVAAVCIATTDANREVAFATFVHALDRNVNTNEKRQVVALYALGEFGRQLVVTSYPDVKATLLASFSTSTTTNSEDIKAAAAYALGSICVGNMAEYLEPIMAELERGEHSYLLLSSLREVIVDHAASPQHGFTAYVPRVVRVLTTLSERDEEGVRNMVAECLGKLALTNGDALVPVVAQLCAATSTPHARWTGVTSLKFALAATADAAAVARVVAHIAPFLAALTDADLSVRRAALLALNTGAHHHASAFVPFVHAPIVPALLAATEIKLERTVDLGPFKHKVDDGLALRKAAFACLDTLVETLPAQLDTAALLPHLVLGLRDQDDVQMLAHQILVKLCRVQPGAVVGALDALVEPLEKTTSKRVKDDQVGTEVERAKDLIRSALRAVDAVSAVRDADAHPKFAVFLENVRTHKTLAPQLEAIKNERLSA